MRLVPLLLAALATVGQIVRAEDELIFVKVFNGKTIPIEFESSDTVDRLKGKIKEVESVPLKQQQLIFEDQLLEDGKRLQEYGLVAGSIVTLHINQKGDSAQRIIVEDLLDNRTITLPFEPNMTVANVISDFIGLPRHAHVVQGFMHVFFGNKMLDDDQRPLSDYNISAWSTLTVVLRQGRRFGKILAKAAGRNTIAINVYAGDTVAVIKDMIERTEDIPRDQQRLIFSDKQRENDDDTLDDLDTDIWPIVTLKLVPGIGPKQFIDIQTLDNKIMSFEVDLNDRVSSLKALIAEKTRVPSHLQQLVFGGKLLLDDEKRMSDYNIAAWSTLTLVVRPRDNPTERVIIKTLTNRTIIIDIDLRDSIAILKDKIRQKTDVPPCLQQLVYEHKLLEDDDQLSDYGIKNGTTVYMVLYLHGAEPWSGSTE